ncbi:MAG: capsule assembly Wzi family protein [Gemmatimonadota bacterium]
MMRSALLLTPALLLAQALLPAGAAAQACARPAELRSYDLTGPAAELARALSSTHFSDARGSGIFRSSVRGVGVCLDSLSFLAGWSTAGPVRDGVEAAPVQLRVVGNSAYPRSVNDGLLWAGKGLGTVASGGVQGRWRMLSAALIPVAAHQQNGDFPYVGSNRTGRSAFANPDHGGIDLPKRHGEDAFSVVHPGQSFLRVDAGPVRAALSTENLWLGPAQVYPLLLSNSAPGFPHVRVGTSGPIDVWFADLELNVFWGSVSESDHFDGLTRNDHHLFTASSITLEPRLLPGLHLGIARVYHDTLKATGQKLDFYVDRIAESPFWAGGGNRPGNAIGALHLRWVLPESGFEVYGEWAREDTPYDAEEVLREPDWTRTFAGGVQKVFVGPERLTRVYGELINLGASPATVFRGFFTTYTHSQAVHGHTHRGQMLGAGVGPGSDAQRVGADVFSAAAMTGGFIERVRYDDDTYYRRFYRRFGESRHDVELSAGMRRLQRVGQLEVNAELVVSRRWDRDFLSLRTESEETVEDNVHATLGVRWMPRF